MFLRLKPVVVLGLDVPALSFTEFFDETHIVTNVALFLGVDLRDVNIYLNVQFIEINYDGMHDIY